jgi:hypothetical protein
LNHLGASHPVQAELLASGDIFAVTVAHGHIIFALNSKKEDYIIRSELFPVPSHWVLETTDI